MKVGCIDQALPVCRCDLQTTYTYDPENRLTQLATGSGVIGSYSYDGAGDRYAKTAGGVTTIYSLDLASSLPQVLAEDDGTTLTSYAYAGGPLELDKAGTTYWYLSDTLGSVRLVTDSSGASPATYAYSAFGSTRRSTGTLANEVRFTGERTDGESGLEFLRARTYDPSTGTFLQRDSWGITATDSQSIDAYVYTANNPINAVDPSGHMARVYDEGTGGHGTQTVGQAGSSGYTDPVGSGQGSGGSPATPPKPASQPQGRPDCQGNWFCAANNAFGTAGDWGRQGADTFNKGWQASAGGLVNNVHDLASSGVTWAVQHPQLVLAGIGLAIACAAACAALASGALAFATLAAGGEFAGAVTVGCSLGCAAMATLGLPTLTFGATVLHDTIDPSIDAAGIGFGLNPSMDWDFNPYSAAGRWNLRNPNGSGQFISGHDYAYFNNR